jgi:hypothetical protein
MREVSLWLLGGVKAVGGGIRLMARDWGNGVADPKTIGAPFGAPRFCGQGSLSSPPGPASADVICRSL